MSRKAAETIHNINNALAQELLTNVQCSGGSRSFAKETRTLKMRSIVDDHWKLTVTYWEQSSELILLKLKWEVAKKLSIDHSTDISHLTQIGEVKKLDKRVPHELTENKRNYRFEVSSSLILCNNAPFLNRIVTCDKKWILYNNQLSGWSEKKLQSTSQGQTCTTKRSWLLFGGLLPSDPLQLSESWRNCYIWELCSAIWWDALKTSMLTAGISQQKGSSSSPWQCLIARCTTSASKVEWIGLWSFASSSIFTWPLPNQLLV